MTTSGVKGEPTLENICKKPPALPKAISQRQTEVTEDQGTYGKRCFAAKPKDRHGTCEKCRSKRYVSKAEKIRAKLEEMAGFESSPPGGRWTMSAVALGASATQGKRRIAGRWIFSSEKERQEAFSRERTKLRLDRERKTRKRK